MITLITVIASISIFLAVVLIHELGHFLMAKSVGIRVNEFSIGMGPEIYQREKGDTKYSLRLLPIGGYVSMEGEDEDSDDPHSFNNASVWSRIKVIVAGALMNFILAILILTLVYFGVGSPTTVVERSDNQAIFPGDRIVAIDDQPVNSWEDISKHISKLEVCKDIDFIIERNKEEITVPVRPIEKDGATIVGVESKLERSVFQAIKNGFLQTKIFLMSMFDFIGMVFKGQVSTDNLSGPVGVVKEIGNATRLGIFNVLLLAGFISVNLGFFNLLPIPALDGGRLVFLIVELFRGKPMDPNKEGLVHLVGFVLLMSLIVFITYKDIIRIFI